MNMIHLAVEAMMVRYKSSVVGVIALSMIIGFGLFMGCGSSAEKQKMTTLIQEFNQLVDDYAGALKDTDESKKSELIAKVENFMEVWSATKSDMMDAVTPQDLDQLDNEFKKIFQKYKSLVEKS